MTTKRLVPILAGACLLLAGWYLLMPHVGTNAEPPVKKGGGFAADRADDRLPDPAPFDGDRAMRYLRTLCEIGPRISGSAGMQRQQELLEAHFKKHGAQVTWQRFTATQPSQARSVAMANLIASWHPERPRRVVLCTHYDTRPKADQEPDPRRWDEPFVSANDGTAGVAWLMELAHHVEKLSTEVGIDFVLFDGEEWVFDGPVPAAPGRDRYFLGSEHFAAEYRKSATKPRIIAAVLLDLAAGKDAKFPIEQNSGMLAGPLVSEIWGIARKLGVNRFQPQWGPNVLDDHLALNRVGIPAVDIIDFSYPHWHRLSDRPEQCSSETMSDVARVLTVWLQRVR